MLFTAEQTQLAETVRAFAMRELAGGYLARARSDLLPRDELRRLGDNGLLGMSLHPEFGGQGADPVSVGIACESVAYADFNLAYLVFASEIAIAVARTADETIGRALCHSIVAGEDVCALALTEPRGGSDAAHPQVRATQVSGGWQLRGEKTSITLGAHASNAVVVATIDPALGSKGTRRFLVPLDDRSIGIQRFDDPGFIPLSRASASFDDTFVADGRVIGGKRSGVGAQLAGFDLTRSLLGLMVVGAAQRALDMATEYMKERQVFGQPLSKNQGVSFVVAERQTEVEAARWLCYRALSLAAARQPHTAEAAMCKWWAPKVALQTINDCVVLHGHVGWSMEMPLMQMMLDVSGLQIGDGTPQIQKLLIARQKFGREFV